MRALTGLGVALITPFTDDLSVDAMALRKIVNFCIDGGVDYLVVLGTTGESATLSKEEKDFVLETVISENNGKLPLVVGIGGNNTAELVKELNNNPLDHFDAVLSVSPYYNKPTQEGIFQHYKALSKASSKPIIMYNVPGRTGSNMLPDTVLRLASECNNLVGIKEASGDMSQIRSIIENKRTDFLVLSGDDITALPTVLAGGDGVISVIGQGLPRELSQMIHMGLDGKTEEAYAIHNALKEGFELIFEEGNPAGIKAIFEIQGLSLAKVRLPLVEASTMLKGKIDQFIKDFSKIHA